MRGRLFTTCARLTKPLGPCSQGPSPWNAGKTDCAGLRNGLNMCDTDGASLHLQRVADVIERLGADILNMVEVEGCAILRRLATEMLPDAGYTPFLKRGTDYFLGQNVGLLTRVGPSGPLTRSSDRADYPVDGSACGATSKVGFGRIVASETEALILLVNLV